MKDERTFYPITALKIPVSQKSWLGLGGMGGERVWRVGLKSN